MNTYLVLLNKELRLQKNNLLFALVFFLLILIAFTMQQTPLGKMKLNFSNVDALLDFVIWMVGIFGGLVFFPVMIGGSATADEEGLNTKPWQNSLPITQRSLFLFKTGVVIFVSITVSLTFLYTTLRIQQKESFPLGFFLIPILAVAIGIYCGTLVFKPLKVLGVSFILSACIMTMKNYLERYHSQIAFSIPEFSIPNFEECVLISIILIIFGLINYTRSQLFRYVIVIQWLTVFLILLMSNVIFHTDFKKISSNTQAAITKIYNETFNAKEMERQKRESEIAARKELEKQKRDSVIAARLEAAQNAEIAKETLERLEYRFEPDVAFPIPPRRIRGDVISGSHGLLRPESYASRSSRWQDIVSGSMANDVNRPFLTIGYREVDVRVGHVNSSTFPYNGENLDSSTTSETLPEDYKNMFAYFGNRFHTISADATKLPQISWNKVKHEPNQFYRIVTSQRYNTATYYESGILSHDPYKNRAAFLRLGTIGTIKTVYFYTIDLDTMQELLIGSMSLDENSNNDFLIATWKKTGELIFRSNTSAVEFFKPSLQ